MRACFVFAIVFCAACRAGHGNVGRAPPSGIITRPVPVVIRPGDSSGVISGIVVDDSLGHPIWSADIRISGKLVAVTDSLGRFRFLFAPGTDTLQIRRLGYDGRRESVTMSPSVGLYLVIPLAPSTLDLSEVCACDPSPRLSVALRSANPTVPIVRAVIIVKMGGKLVVTDSVSASDFSNGTADRVVLWFNGGPPTGPARGKIASLEIRAPGFHVWRKQKVWLPGTVPAELVPVR